MSGLIKFNLTIDKRPQKPSAIVLREISEHTKYILRQNAVINQTIYIREGDSCYGMMVYYGYVTYARSLRVVNIIRNALMCGALAARAQRQLEAINPDNNEVAVLNALIINLEAIKTEQKKPTSNLMFQVTNSSVLNYEAAMVVKCIEDALAGTSIQKYRGVLEAYSIRFKQQYNITTTPPSLIESRI